MNTEVLAQAQQAGIELSPEAAREVAGNVDVVQSTIQNPALKEPVAVPKTDVETKLDSLTQDAAPESQEPESGKDDELSWLDLPEDLGLEETKEPLELPETPEAQKFAEDFKQYLGFEVNELREGIQTFKQMQQEIESYRAQKAADAQLKSLRQEWGVEGTDFDARMAKVVDRFNKYPPEMKAKLDGIEGAKLIWAKIQQEEAAKTARPDVPTFDRTRSVGVTGAGVKPQFTKAEIAAMDDATYAKNADAIFYAYANGLVQ